MLDRHVYNGPTWQRGGRLNRWNSGSESISLVTLTVVSDNILLLEVYLFFFHVFHYCEGYHFLNKKWIHNVKIGKVNRKSFASLSPA